jgi:hypothetical protein
MALPKKKKRLGEITQVELPALIKKDGNMLPSAGTERITNEQMEKAFELVDHIEHGDPLPPSALRSQKGTEISESLNPEAIQVRFSIGTPSSETTLSDHKAEGSTPFIDVHVKIPSFLWKVPIMRDVTRHLIKKLTKV